MDPTAFPCIDSRQVGDRGEYTTEIYSYGGMSLRDYFAAASIPPLRDKLSHPGDVAREAYKLADAMMKARNA